MKCKYCGHELQDGSTFCTQCGRSLGEKPKMKVARAIGEEKPDVIVLPKDGPSFGFAFLSFLIPLVGLVLYLVWKDLLPRRAHSCGFGALVSVVVSLVLNVILFFVFLANGGVTIHFPLWFLIILVGPAGS